MEFKGYKKVVYTLVWFKLTQNNPDNGSIENQAQDEDEGVETYDDNLLPGSKDDGISVTAHSWLTNSHLQCTSNQGVGGEGWEWT